MKRDEPSLTADAMNDGSRYHVWFCIPTDKTKLASANGSFTDTFRALEIRKDKHQYAVFNDHAPLDTRHITYILPAYLDEDCED